LFVPKNQRWDCWQAVELPLAMPGLAAQVSFLCCPLLCASNAILPSLSSHHHRFAPICNSNWVPTKNRWWYQHWVVVVWMVRQRGIVPLRSRRRSKGATNLCTGSAEELCTSVLPELSRLIPIIFLLLSYPERHDFFIFSLYLFLFVWFCKAKNMIFVVSRNCGHIQIAVSNFMYTCRTGKRIDAIRWFWRISASCLLKELVPMIFPFGLPHTATCLLKCLKESMPLSGP
jgi:hypothetical protein